MRAMNHINSRGSNRQSVFTGDSSLPPEVVERCHRIFKRYDKDNSGEIDRFELKDAMKGIYVSTIRCEHLYH